LKKKISTRVIATSKNLSRIKGAKIRFLPKKYASPVGINIYADKVAIIHWSKDPITILIKSEEIMKAYKKYFELMWKIAKE